MSYFKGLLPDGAPQLVLDPIYQELEEAAKPRGSISFIAMCDHLPTQAERVGIDDELASWLSGLLGGQDQLDRAIIACEQALRAKQRLSEETCPWCHTLHVDEGAFAVKAHWKHICAHCRKSFRRSKATVSTPLAQAAPYLEEDQLRLEDPNSLPTGQEVHPTVQAVWDEALRGQPCRECGGLEDEPNMIICDRCSEVFHPTCANTRGTTPVRAGPWFCFRCRGQLFLTGIADPMEDVNLLDYLFGDVTPASEDEAARVRNLASSFRASGQELQVNVKQLGLEDQYRWVSIPPIPMRM